MKIGILGGGLTGLTIAANLDSRFEVRVLEKEPDCGGLCKSIEQDGFTFDSGGAHIIFSKNQRYMDYVGTLLDGNCARGRRNNKVLYKSSYVKYPFENGLHDLPSKQDIFECIYGYLYNNNPKPGNFKEWICHTFGDGIARKYLIPYNEKIWNYPLDKMSMHWVDGRVPKPPPEDVLKSAIGIETEGYTHQLYFYYPEKGGIQAVIKALENKLAAGAITTNCEIKKVAKKGSGWRVTDGLRDFEFDCLISTIPVFELINALDNVPPKVLKAVKGLKYNSLICIMAAVEGNDLPDYTAVYIPDPGFKPNRIAFPRNFSSRNCPQGQSSVVAEITANFGDDAWQMDDETIANHVIDGLVDAGIVDSSKVIFTKVIRSKYAYVIYDLDYQSNIRTVREYIKSLGIHLCGRFAEFEYLNMDACVERALEQAKAL
jgi:protoporphyrinogen oxidase